MREADLYEITQIEAKFHRATSHHDLNLMMSLWAPGSVFNIGTSTLIGKQQIRHWFATGNSAFKAGDNWESDTPSYKIRINARRRTPPAELPVHEGQDWMYVLSGRLRLILGDKDFVIKPGEAVEFSTWTPHWFGTIDGPVEAITLFGVHGERLHLHN